MKSSFNALLSRRIRPPNVQQKYTFNGIFPVNITEMEVDWNATDIIQEFQVTFQYDWWEISGGSTGNAGGN